MNGESHSGAHPRLGDIVSIALPIVTNQASETVMMFVDRLFVSRLTPLHITGAMSDGLTS